MKIRDVPDRMQHIRDRMARGLCEEAESLTLGLYLDVLRKIAEGGPGAQELAAAALEAEWILGRVVLAAAPDGNEVEERAE